MVSSNSTPQKKATSATACSNGSLVPSRATPSASVALNSPGSSSSSSSRGKKTGSARGAYRVATLQVQVCTLPRRPNPASLTPACLQLTTTRRAAWPLIRRLSSHIGDRAGVDYLTQRSRLQLLHRLEDRVLNL